MIYSHHHQQQHHHHQRRQQQPNVVGVDVHDNDYSCCCCCTISRRSSRTRRTCYKDNGTYSFNVRKLLLVLLVQYVITIATVTSSSSIVGVVGVVVEAFAVPKKPPTNKNNNNKKSTSSSTTGKGFGVPISKTNDEEYKELITKYRTRVPSQDIIKDGTKLLLCPCGSTLSYNDCCYPYHQHEQYCDSPERVLRSRYSAFTYRIIPYVIATTHPSNRDYRTNKVTWAKELNANGMFDSYDFIALENIQPSENNTDNDNVAYIQFKVRLRARDGTQDEIVITETSKFLKPTISDNNDTTQNHHLWLYASGDVRSETINNKDLQIKLN